MKRLFTTLCIILIGVCSYSQTWTIIHQDADIVKGTEDATFMIHQGDGFIIQFQKDAPKPYKTFALQLAPGKMFSDGTPDMPYCRVDLKIGLLDEAGNVVDHFTLYLRSQGEEKWKTARYNGDVVGCKKGCQKIIDHVLSGQGPVRIIIPIYNGQDIDETIRCN